MVLFEDTASMLQQQREGSLRTGVDEPTFAQGLFEYCQNWPNLRNPMKRHHRNDGLMAYRWLYETAPPATDSIF